MLGAVALAFAIARTIDPAIDRAWPDLVLFRFPHLDDPVARAIDLSFGLALTAVAEELVFRKLALNLFVDRLGSAGTLWFSSVLFGLIHWSSGLGPIVGGALIGAVFMLLLRKTNSVIPAIGAHYLVNLAIVY